jgi:16S rRNA G966 N2-methylase RsmD
MTALAKNSDYVSPYAPKPDEKNLVTDSLSEMFKAREEASLHIDSLSDIASNYTNVMFYFSETIPSNIFCDADSARKKMDARYWERLLENKTSILSTLPAQRKAEWDSLIDKKNTPPFTREHVIPTLRALEMEMPLFFAERVDSVFHALSPNHVTNSPAAFGNRLILNKAHDTGSATIEKSRVLDDLRTVIATINGRCSTSVRDALSHTILNNLLKHQLYGKWITIDGGAVRIKIFKVGTMHIEIHPEVSYKLNDVLSMSYPLAIPARFRHSPSQNSKKQLPPPIKETLSFSLLSDLSSMKRFDTRHCLDLRRAYPDHDTIFSVGTTKLSHPEKVESILLSLGGKIIHKNTWEFSYNVCKVIDTIVLTGTFPDKRSHQYYPSKGEIGQRAANKLRENLVSPETANLLEPSAGQGHLCEAFGEASWTLLDISEVNTSVLSEKFTSADSIETVDFLKWETKKSFDGILMNPPYANEQAFLHVKHAAQFLSDNGTLVAIMPVGNQVYNTVSWASSLGFEVSGDEPVEGAFEDASVSVQIIKITKKKHS